MRSTIAGVVIFLSASQILAGTAAAEKFKLTYKFTFGKVLEADITGDLQDDGNTIIVTAVDNARLDGLPGPDLVFVKSLSDLVDGTDNKKPVLTLDGKGSDITICSDNTCTKEFITFDGIKQFFGIPGIFTSPVFGGTYSGGSNAAEKYDPDNYSLKAD